MSKICTTCKRKTSPSWTNTENGGNDFFCNLICYEKHCKDELKKEKDNKKKESFYTMKH